MIKYNFKVEVPFLDKTNKLAEVKKDAVLVVTEERLKQAKYIADVRARNIKNAGIAAVCEYLLG